MIKLLILILVGFVVYSLVQGLLRGPQNRGGGVPRNRTRKGEQMVEDPQCGTFLPVSEAISSRIDGKELHFCSKQCLKDYKKQH